MSCYILYCFIHHPVISCIYIEDSNQTFVDVAAQGIPEASELPVASPCREVIKPTIKPQKIAAVESQEALEPPQESQEALEPPQESQEALEPPQESQEANPETILVDDDDDDDYEVLTQMDHVSPDTDNQLWLDMQDSQPEAWRYIDPDFPELMEIPSDVGLDGDGLGGSPPGGTTSPIPGAEGVKGMPIVEDMDDGHKAGPVLLLIYQGLMVSS